MAGQSNKTYMAHIDGLRAVAVLSVLLFHADIALFSGGFVGVDIFFVISGFLVTSILMKETDRGRLSMVGFYERRVRRLAPALVIVIVASLIAGLLMVPPARLSNLAASAVSAVLFVSNIYFWLQPGGYFAEAHWTQPLLHMWSLAVEEQFYFVFPLLLWLLTRYAPRARVSVLAIFCAGSLTLACFGAFVKPAATFFLLPTRFWELLLGSLLAFGHEKTRRLEAGPASAAAWIGAALCVIPAVVYDHNTPFPGVAAIWPTLGAALLIAAGNSSPGLVARALSSRPMVTMGLISYPLYLWHWPILVYLNALEYGRPTQEAKVFALLLSVLLAWLTYQFVEQPIRKRRVLVARQPLFWSAAAAGALICAFSAVLIQYSGLPQRAGSDMIAAAMGNEGVAKEWSYPCDNFARKIDAQHPINFCVAGTGASTILFWGDSHNEQIFSEAARLFGVSDGKDAWKLVFATSGGCLPIVGQERTNRRFACNSFAEAALDRALEPDVKKVVIAGFWTDYFPDQNYISTTFNFERLVRGKRAPFSGRPDIVDFLGRALESQIKLLTAAGKRVVVVLPYPVFKVPPAEYIWRRMLWRLPLQTLLTLEQHSQQKQDFIAELRRAAERGGAAIADPAPLLCRAGPCEYEEGGISLYRDDNHLVPRGVKRLTAMLTELLQ